MKIYLKPYSLEGIEIDEASQDELKQYLKSVWERLALFIAVLLAQIRGCFSDTIFIAYGSFTALVVFVILMIRELIIYFKVKAKLRCS